MIRNSAKLTGLVAVVAIGGAIGLNCSSNKGSASDGTVKIAVVNAASEGVLSVSYIIHAGLPVPPGPAITDVTGSINVTDPNSTPSVDHSFPASTGDTVTMTATGTGGVLCTGTSLPFDLAAGGSAAVNVSITCPNGGNTTPNQNSGDVIVTGNFVSTGDNCPLLTSWVASPLQTSGPGGVVNVDGTATDSDVGNTLAYTWKASAGSFGKAFPSASATTTYACPAVAPGTTQAETLSLSVDDGHGCIATLPHAITITCVGVTVATGTGGTPATGGTTGTGGVGTAGTTGTGGTPATGGTTGTGGVGTAGTTGTGGVGTAGTTGTGGVGTAGTTGTGGVATGGTTGTGGVATGGTTGTGGVATGGTTGTGGVATGGTTGGGQVACESAGAATLTECFGTSPTQADGQTPLGGFGCAGFPAAQAATCQAFQACLDSAACVAQVNAAVANDPSDYPYNDDATPCLCGIGPTAANPTGQTKAQCLGGPPATGWAGVCQAQFAAAAGGAANVASHFFDRSEPIGIAVNLFTCDVDASCIPASGL